ncbi:hypothetical protein [Kushneria marisflavi]|uniref:Uncharacterized protein n=1 Tax=Kushneria marisflavi TaxID=157779 RepID=A0A240UQG8_9GAMM|nr:hypothetical protein [Kushneria marisflavi]ART63731.1 hypothetical protein B9H00_12255 [Kushneria marisflavi]RKD85414.1 hypothetical protein C8D96_1303 [Kushneria marisflavi]
MVTERARRQYLEAMGINLWVARHPLPNALASSLPEVEPVTDERAATLDHHQRLHALIDEFDHPEAPPRPTTPEPESALRETTRPARSIKALLDHGRNGEKARADSVAAPTPAAPVVEAPDTTTRDVVASPARSAHEPLRFSVQVAALDGRWLVLLARDEALSDQEETLFKAILQAGGVEPSASLSCQRFGWPMMEGLPVDDALDEARQGFKAFLAGRRARGWAPERILLFGRLPVLEEVLDVQDGQSRVLDLPFWQGPSLESLASASARRALWATMGEWQRWWQGQIAGQDNNDA